MNEEKLANAFKLIYAYRAGQLPVGAEISEEQLDLLKLLCEDLLPTESFDEQGLATLIPWLAEVDSLWNKRTMALTNEFYALKEGGHDREAEERRKGFIEACPSTWYRGIVDSL